MKNRNRTSFQPCGVVRQLLLAAFLAVSVFSLNLSSSSPSQAASASDLGTLATGLGTLIDGLKRLAEDAAANGDQVLQNRIEQAVTALQLVLDDVKKVMKEGGKEVNAIVDETMTEVFGILGTLHDDASDIGAFASAKLNLALASTTSLVDKLPLVNADPALYSIVPSRIEPTDAGRSIRLFGFFPGDLGDDIRVTVDGKLVKAMRSASGSLKFSLPKSISLAENKEVAIDVEVDKHYGPFGWLWETHKFDDSILVGKKEPMVCNITTYRENPDYLKSITATVAVSYDAKTQGGASRPNENRNIPATDLFWQTVGATEAAKFDLDTVRIIETGARINLYGACNGKGPSGSVGIASQGRQLVVNLHAPSLPLSVKCHGLIPKCKTCDAGGTHAVATVTPKFIAAAKNGQPLKSVSVDEVRVGAAGTSRPNNVPATGPWAIHIKCAFAEGNASWSAQTMVLNDGNRRASARAVVSRVENDRLLIEPLNPLKLEAGFQ